MARNKRCLCVDCKPATEKTALELIMFAKTDSPTKEKPKNEPKSPKNHQNLSKLAPKIQNDLAEEKIEKKLNAKLDSLRDEIKELETELGLDDFSIKKRQIFSHYSPRISQIAKEERASRELDLRCFFVEKEENSIPEKEKADTNIGKKHALKKYDYFALNTSCFWGSI